MGDYNIKIDKIIKEGHEGKHKTEIWAKIEDLGSGTVMNKLIWWEDENGVYHDETPDLSTDLRKAIDRVWIETSRKW